MDSAQDIRDKLKKQREKWMRERDLNEDKNEILQNVEFREFQGSQSPQKSDKMNAKIHGSAIKEKKILNTQEMMDQLFVKMSERLEQRFKAQLGPPSFKENNKSGQEMEESLHDQVMSNRCPICFELFLPPDHQPFILFPCGHTYCKQCINTYSKQNKKCPFCRSTFNSMAPNISLQNLIISANEKRDEVVNKLNKQNQSFFDGQATALINEFNNMTLSNLEPQNGQSKEQLNHDHKLQIDQLKAQQYINNFKNLESRISIMQEEYEDAKINYKNIKNTMKIKEEALSTLNNEKKDCLDRLKKIQKELQLIDEFVSKQKEEIDDLKEKEQKQEETMKFIEFTLQPLKQEKQKMRVLVESIAPQYIQQMM